MENPNQSSVPVSNRGMFGDVEVLKVDSQRLNIARETAFNFQNIVAIPSIGIFADGVFWVTLFASVTRLFIVLFYIQTPFQIIFFIFSIPTILLISIFSLTWNKGKFMIHWTYRLSLISSGIMIATQGFSMYR